MTSLPMDSAIHLSTVGFDLEFDDVWPVLTDPLEFPALFPNWVRSVEGDRDVDGVYRGTGPAGDEFTIEPVVDRGVGVIDFEIVAETGNVERSRSRLFALEGGRCQWVHLAQRWAGVDDEGWRAHVAGTDQDLETAKRVLEDRFG